MLVVRRALAYFSTLDVKYKMYMHIVKHKYAYYFFDGVNMHIIEHKQAQICTSN